MSDTNFLAQIYSDGFKGLPDGWKSLERVNFVVGENSSGKTSFFDILEILATSDFSFLNQILGVVEGLQDADDVVRRSNERKEIDIGYIRPTGKKDDELQSYMGLIITYQKNHSNLRVSSLTTVLDRKAFKVKQSGKKIMGKLFDAPDKHIGIKKLCNLALAAHRDTSRGYSKLFDVEDGPVDSMQMWVAAKMNAFDIIQEDSLSSSNRRRVISYLMSAGYKILRYGPIRSETSKIITASFRSDFDTSGGHFPHRLKAVEEKNPAALEALKSFGAESGLFDDVRIERLSGGKTEAFSILYSKNGTEFHASELGYGLGQIMPIVTDLLASEPGETYLIQQPEVHLHPRAQAAFSNFLNKVSDSGTTIVVETHSDFMIDRFRIAEAKRQNHVKSQILFFEFDQKKKSSKFSIIPIERDGTLRDPPDSYRSFFVNEAISVFETL
jgi:predicted ATPase